ncbi:MAG: deoxyribose-phosphate aldolase [Planctomycetota bacterium]|nr:MAG: deoxyribose-phosphate aldolase [Planctomycetota bacterium]
MAITVQDLANMIDHSLLHPTMTDDDIKEGCLLAMKYNAASVCLKPYAIFMAKDILKDSDVMVGSVIGFPHGNNTVAIKVAETKQACEDGAVEIDMVVNIGKVKGGDFDFVAKEIKSINEATLAGGAILKVIFENDYLDENEISKLCAICSEIDVAFVKTSSGYGFVKQENGMYSYEGATAPHLKLMRKETKDSIEVKAAGGVRTLPDLLYVRSIGVTRIGATATAKILDDATDVLASGKTLEEMTPTGIGIGSGGGY